MNTLRTTKTYFNDLIFHKPSQTTFTLLPITRDTDMPHKTPSTSESDCVSRYNTRAVLSLQGDCHSPTQVSTRQKTGSVSLFRRSATCWCVGRRCPRVTSNAVLPPPPGYSRLDDRMFLSRTFLLVVFCAKMI